MFERINVTSHLPSLALQSAVVNKQQVIHPSWASQTDHCNVAVKCLWDNPRLHEEVRSLANKLMRSQTQSCGRRKKSFGF